MRKSIYSTQYEAFLGLLVGSRKAAGLTQRQLAKKLRSTQSMVSKAENGERRLDVVELFAWCAALGKRFSEFTAELDAELGGGSR